MHELFFQFVSYGVFIIEIIGVLVILDGTIRATFLYVAEYFKKTTQHSSVILGQGLSQGLAFLMVSEALKTIILPTVNDLTILGLVMLLRAGMVLLTHWELKQTEHH